MATRRTNRLPEFKVLRDSFQNVEDTISTILKEKDEKIRELEKRLEERNIEVAAFDLMFLEHIDCEASINALEKRCLALQQENHQLKDENETLRFTASANQYQYDQVKTQAEDLRSQLNSRKRKWEVMKEVMEGDHYDREQRPGGYGQE
jgi:chromosome segregation ATPase